MERSRVCVEGTDTQTLGRLIINVRIFDLRVSTDKQPDKLLTHRHRCGDGQGDTLNKSVEINDSPVVS